jgi:hypothetical protein
MVRPERRDVLADERSVRVSAGAPGSRLQAGGEIRPYEAECRKPLKKRGARKRAAISSERCSHVIFSAERCLKGPSRSFRGEGNRQHSVKPDGVLDLSGVEGGGTFPKSIAEQERPYLAAESGKDRAYKAGRRKACGVRRESEGFDQRRRRRFDLILDKLGFVLRSGSVPMKACNTTRRREGTLL